MVFPFPLANGTIPGEPGGKRFWAHGLYDKRNPLRAPQIQGSTSKPPRPKREGPGRGIFPARPVFRIEFRLAY